MSLFAALSPLFLAAASPAASPCTPIPGWEKVAEANPRWIVIGEVHGTNEVPAIFADTVCLAAQSRPVIVALEQPAQDQAAVDAFIASDGGAEAKAAFLRSWMWNNRFKDGRSSQAYFRLFERLRQMHSARQVLSVAVFQSTVQPDDKGQGPYEERMAKTVRELAPADAPVLVLVGNLHAMKTETAFGQAPFLPMSAHLPANQTITLNTQMDGGSAWNCSKPNECGPTPMRAALASHPRGIEWSANAPEYSGVLHVGSVATASEPQVVATE